MRGTKSTGKCLALVGVVAAFAVATAFGFATATQVSGSPMFPNLRQMASESSHVNSDQQRDFEEHLAKKRAEFQRNMDRVKAENDEMRRKFDEL